MMYFTRQKTPTKKSTIFAVNDKYECRKVNPPENVTTEWKRIIPFFEESIRATGTVKGWHKISEEDYFILKLG